MLTTIRPELHERYPYDKIPTSDYEIEAEEMSGIGAKKTWPDLGSTERQLPNAVYITETATVEQCRAALSRIEKRVSRKVTATISTGDVYFYNLEATSNYATIFGGLFDSGIPEPPSQLHNLLTTMSRTPTSTMSMSQSTDHSWETLLLAPLKK